MYAEQVLKTLWEKEKLLVRNCLVRAIFPFPSVFYCCGELTVIFIRLQIVVCKVFQFRRGQDLSFDKNLTPDYLAPHQASPNCNVSSKEGFPILLFFFYFANYFFSGTMYHLDHFGLFFVKFQFGRNDIFICCFFTYISCSDDKRSHLILLYPVAPL